MRASSSSSFAIAYRLETFTRADDIIYDLRVLIPITIYVRTRFITSVHLITAAAISTSRKIEHLTGIKSDKCENDHEGSLNLPI